MDNRIFNINGSGKDMLLRAIELACLQKSSNNPTIKGWMETKESGLILCWTDGDGVTKLPTPVTAEQFLPIALNWLDSDFAKQVELSEMCDNCDHDGHNSMGWQVYCEDWGHVGRANWRAICAIKPAYMWHGK